MNKEHTILRIYVASGKDSNLEYQCLKEVVEKLNQPEEYTSQIGVKLKTYYWSSFLDYYIKKEKKFEIETWPLKQWDLFIGILRFAFDIDNSKESKEFPTGSEEVFEYACQSWKKTGKPKFLLYRSHRNFSAADIDIEQFTKIQEFFEKNAAETRKRTPYRAFKETEQFKLSLENFLLNNLKEFERHRLLTKQTEEIQLIMDQDEPDKGKQKYGETPIQKMAFLRVNSLLHNPQLKHLPINEQAILLRNYYDFVTGIINDYQGVPILWNVEGGVWVFIGASSYNNAVKAGFILIAQQESFNNNRKLNPSEENFKPRLSAICEQCEAPYPSNHPYIHCTNYATHLEKNNAHPGVFVITNTLYNKIDPKLREGLYFEEYQEFHFSLYIHKLPSEKEPLSDFELTEIETKIEDNIGIISENVKLALLSGNVTHDYIAMRDYVERIYRNFKNFLFRAEDYDPMWSGEYFQIISNFYIDTLKAKDEQLVKIFDDLSIILKEKNLVKPILQSIRDFVAVLRTFSMSRLDFLFRLLIRLPSELNLNSIAESYVEEKINTFVTSNEIEEEKAFTELFFLTADLKQTLIRFISNKHKNGLHTSLISRFWNLAYFICIEDYCDANNNLFSIISTTNNQINSKIHNFRVIQELLKEDALPKKKSIENHFQNLEITPSEEDISIAWKCLLISSQNEKTRKFVLEEIEFKKLWDIIYYSKTPLFILKEICEHLLQARENAEDKSEEEIRMKFFFSFTLFYLINILFNKPSQKLLSHIGAMIEIFYKFDFFSSENDFQRLNDLTIRYQRVSGVELKEIETARRRLKEITAPVQIVDEIYFKILNELPPTVQRKMARDGYYLEHFCESNHNEVASEVKRYIHPNNIGQYLFRAHINTKLFEDLLKDPVLFKDRSLISKVLNYPKCTRTFAETHASKLPHWELEKIVDNPHANYAVKDYIKIKFNISRKVKLVSL